MKLSSIHSYRTEARPSERGFTLIEVMVAIVILTVGLLSLAQMMVLATNSNSLSGRMTSCSGHAKEQLERLKAIPFYSDPDAQTRSEVLQDGGSVEDPGGGGYVRYYDPEGQVVAAGASLYEVRWEIETITNTGLPLEMLEIQVRCLPTNLNDQFSVVGEAWFTTYRTANVSTGAP